MKTIKLLFTVVMALVAMTARTQTWNIGYPNETDVVATLTDGTLVICGTGDTKNYDASYYVPWHDVNKQILNVIIQDGVTSIGNSLFAGCSSLKSITIPNSVISIGVFTFDSCINLTSVTIPNGIIGFESFVACGGLTSVTIGSGVTKIGDGAFTDCVNITFITVFNPDPGAISIGNDVFGNVNINNCILSVPVGSIESYRNAPVWQDFLYIAGGTDITTGDVKLANLTVNAGTLSPEFSPAMRIYKVTVPKSVENIVLTATPMDNNATVLSDGEKALIIGENTFMVKVSNSLGTSGYMVIINRTPTDYFLDLVRYTEMTTGSITTTYTDLVVNQNVTKPIIDRYELDYTLTTGSFSGDIPLHFDIGDGQKIYDKTISVDANSIYKITLNITIDYAQYGDIWTTTAYYNGRPNSTSINYRRHSCDVIASEGNEVLSTDSINIAGSYITNISASDLSFIGNGNFTSIKKLPVVQSISIFSSPAADFITVSGLQGNETLYVYNINGQLLITRKAISETETVQIGNLPSGIYLLKTNNGQTFKWVKR